MMENEAYWQVEAEALGHNRNRSGVLIKHSALQAGIERPAVALFNSIPS